MELFAKAKTDDGFSREEIKAQLLCSLEGRTLKNVLLGEVWLCGGQSNMDVSFRGLANQPVADAHLQMRADGSAGEDGGMFWLYGPDFHVGILGFEGFPNACDGTAGADA